MLGRSHEDREDRRRVEFQRYYNPFIEVQVWIAANSSVRNELNACVWNWESVQHAEALANFYGGQI